MNVLVVEPLKAPYEKAIDPGLESLQHEVGGWIEAMGLDEDVCIICNEEGKLNGLELNRSIKDDRGRITDIIAGTFLVVGSGEENFDSLTPAQMEKYKKQFRYPETFMRFGGEIVAIPIKPHSRSAGEKHKTEPER